MFYIVFTQPNQFTKNYETAVDIMAKHYESTGEVVAIEAAEFVDK